MTLRRLPLYMLATIPALACASERHFTYAQESAVLTAGEKEVELSVTNRRGRYNAYYSALDLRLELELGVTDRFQTAFYLNFKSETTEAADGSLTTENEVQGISWETKYKFSDPVADPVGFALYSEVSIESHAYDFEVKAIADKRVGDHILAANLVYELEADEQARTTDLEHKIEVIASSIHLFNPRFGLGIEARFANVFPEAGANHSALFIGPCAFYNAKSFWTSLTVLPQVMSFGHETANTGIDLDEFSRLEIRLIVGAHF